MIQIIREKQDVFHNLCESVRFQYSTLVSTLKTLVDAVGELPKTAGDQRSQLADAYNEATALLVKLRG